MADIHVAKPLSSIKDVLSTRYPSESWDLTSQDLEVLQRVARVVAKRASALVAASVYSLYAVREESTVGAGSKANVACAGSIIQHYPDFYKDTQDMLRKLSKLNGQPEDSIELVIAVESSLLGAAVASAEVACAARNKESQV
jgi:hexokinase